MSSPRTRSRTVASDRNPGGVPVRRWRGGCHCGAVKFEATGRLEVVEECNCSICTRKAYLHWIIPRDAFRLLTPRDALGVYTFNTGVARHYFCRHCGIASFYAPRSDPDMIDINARCLEGVELTTLRIETFDGRNWERAYAQRRPGRRA